MIKKYDILFLLSSGIGNTLLHLYSVEYLLRLGVNVAIYPHAVNKSFVNYLIDCYGAQVILDSIAEVETEMLFHSFTYQEKITIKTSRYFYFYHDFHSSSMVSEAEQFLQASESLFPGGQKQYLLEKLKEDYSDQIKAISTTNPVVLYPGNSPAVSVRRWPHFNELEHLLSQSGEKVVYIGANDDLDFSKSYIFPNWLGWLPQAVFNRQYFWDFFRFLKLLRPYAHFTELEAKDNAYIQSFSWYELVALLKRAKYFIGNDGGLSHLAAAVGEKGAVIFGPTSIGKNKPYNTKFTPVSLQYQCQPCQFGVGGILMMKGFINCPYEVKCLNYLSPQQMMNHFKKEIN